MNNTVEFSTLTHQGIIQLVDRHLHNKRVTPEEYLRHWLWVIRHFVISEQDNSWDEFEAAFAFLIAKLVMAEKEITAIRQGSWLPVQYQVNKIHPQPEYDALYAFDAENNVEPASVIAERIAAKYGFGETHSMVDDIHYAIEDALELGQRRGQLIPEKHSHD